MVDSIKLEEVAKLDGHTDRVWGLCWSPDGEILASCGGDRNVLIWAKNANGEYTNTFKMEEKHGRTVRRISFTHCGKYLAVCSFDATVSIWSCHGPSAFESVATLEGHTNEVKAVAWNAAGNRLATCSRDKTVWIWEMDDQEEFECAAILHGHTQDVKYVTWHPQEDVLFSFSYDDTVKAWGPEDDDEDEWLCLYTLKAHTSTVWEGSFSSDGKYLASCAGDLNVHVWEAGAGGPRNQLQLVTTLSGYHQRTVYSVDWCKHEQWVATAAADDHIRLFVLDQDSSDLRFVLGASKQSAHEGDVNCVRWCPAEAMAGAVLASGGDDNAVRVWRVSVRE